jgi:membrane-bound ClpP family serine protease
MMGILTIALGAFLSLLGLYAFLSTGSSHPTALIPSGFGVVFLLLGLLARRDKWRMHSMHSAAALSLIGVVMTAPSALKGVGEYLTGAEVVRPMAAFSQFLMALSCGAYLVFSVQSFVEARKERQARQEREEREAREHKSKFRSR